MKLADQCKAVVACRVSPKQKQEIVNMVRKMKPKAITLAIGDGANDVNMITAAHVGVGIKGKEGQQAARASDYAIGEFRFLRRLLFYFGRESYRKNAHLIFYNFYKNVLLVLPHFWFSFFNSFSGQLLYDSWLYQLFNVFYCSLPIIIYALFDEDYPNSSYLELKNTKKNELENQPHKYALGMKSKLFNTKNFWLWVLYGAWHGAVITYVSMIALEMSYISHDGRTSFVTIFGMMVFTGAVLVGNMMILNISNTFYPFHVLIVFLSILFYILNLYIANLFTFFDSCGIFGGYLNKFIKLFLLYF